MLTVISDMLSAWAGLLVVLIAGVLVTVAAMVWILFFRKNRRHRHRHRRSQTENRRLNPTLAQIGGLPPLRQDHKSPVEPAATLTSRS